MRSYTFSASLASLLIVAFVVPTSFLALPRVVHAQQPPLPIAVPIAGSGLNDFIQTIKSILSEVHQYTSMVADLANYVNTYVLQPLAFVMSGQLMKALTSSVIQYVIGKANGTGVPQFVVDVRKSLQSISDFQKQAYLRQVNLTNSPFATSIAQALGIDYNQKTSLAGFWAANMNTLGRGIPTYNNSYLTGNWSRGGIAAWFQLTTQSQNNPYLLYQNTQAQLQSQIGAGAGGSTGARLNELSWGQGFMAWCGATEQTGTTGNNPSAFTANAQGINPGDPCTDKNGNPGTMQTPGSTIKATLDKVLGGQQDKLVQIGNISTQVNQILGNIATVLNTINLAANILGGGSGGVTSGGLLNAGSPSGTLSRFDSSSYGVTSSGIQQAADSSDVTAASKIVPNTNSTAADYGVSGSGSSGGSDMPARVQSYTTSWNAIAASANSASTALQTMMSTCHTYWNGNSTYENAAQNALSFEVTPILTQAAGIKAITDAALAQFDLVKSEPTTSSTYAADLEKLNTMAPTASDVAAAQYSATAYGGARANPAGSLTVADGSLVDQMNLIRNNAAAIQAASCTAQDTGGGA